MAMKSYLSVSFNSEGRKPSEVVERLHMVGFKATKGNYDFVYEWDKNANVQDLIWFADKVYNELKGCKVFFALETLGSPAEGGAVDFPDEDDIDAYRKPQY